MDELRGYVEPHRISFFYLFRLFLFIFLVKPYIHFVISFFCCVCECVFLYFCYKFRFNEIDRDQKKIVYFILFLSFPIGFCSYTYILCHPSMINKNVNTHSTHKWLQSPSRTTFIYTKNTHRNSSTTIFKEQKVISSVPELCDALQMKWKIKKELNKTQHKR